MEAAGIKKLAWLEDDITAVAALLSQGSSSVPKDRELVLSTEPGVMGRSIFCCLYVMAPGGLLGVAVRLGVLVLVLVRARNCSVMNTMRAPVVKPITAA